MSSSASLLLAFPGDSPSHRDSPLGPLIVALEAAGHEIVLVPLDPGAADEQNQATLRTVLQASDAENLVIGGFSLGARMAARLAAEFRPRALLLLGYPFHRLRQSHERHGLGAIEGLTLPTLILQGTRDPHGNREEVRGYRSLPSGLKVHWLEDGNHIFRPRNASGFSLEQHLQSAAEASLLFLSRL